MFLQRRSRELLDNDELQVEWFIKKFNSSGYMSHIHKNIVGQCYKKKQGIIEKNFEKQKFLGQCISHRTQTNGTFWCFMCQTVQKTDFIVESFVRTLDKRTYFFFLISQPKHMLYVLKRTDSMRRFSNSLNKTVLLSTQNICEKW